MMGLELMPSRLIQSVLFRYAGVDGRALFVGMA